MCVSTISGKPIENKCICPLCMGQFYPIDFSEIHFSSYFLYVAIVKMHQMPVSTAVSAVIGQAQ